MVISPFRFEFCGLVAVFFGENYAKQRDSIILVIIS